MRHLIPQEQRIGLLPFPARFNCDRIKGKRALARARDTGEYHKFTFRNRNINMLQIILGCTEYFNLVFLLHKYPPLIIS